MNAYSRRPLTSILLFLVFSLTSLAAYPPMGVYKGSRGGSSAPSYSDYAGMRQFESWFGHQVPRSIEFIANDSWSQFSGAANWAVNLTSGWPPQRWRATYSIPLLPADGSSTLAQGAAGNFNSYFANVAQILVAAGEGDAVLRLGWEMNGNWYPWKVLNATDAANYRDYWIQIVTAMRGVPGANFKFDFCPIVGQQSYPPINAYPGDAYVDIVGLDVYNTSYTTTDPATRWNELLNETYGIKYWADFATAHGKQISYPEWATGIRTGDASGGGDDPLFIQNMYTWIMTHDVAYHNYWDYQAPDFHGQLSNDQFPNSAAKLKELFGALFAGQVPAPDKLSASAGNSRVALAWTAVSGATSYNILRSTSLGHTFTTIGSATTTNFIDTGLTNGTTFNYVVTAMNSGVESTPSPRVTATPIDATLVDDADSSGVLVNGSWTSSTSGENYFGLDYLHDGNTGSTVPKSVTFTPTLPAAGSYNVYARWTSGSNRATNTPVTVTSNAGTTPLVLNQQINGGGWYLLGTYDFAAGSSGSVLISNTAANGYVIADAVAFIATSSAQPPAIPAGVTSTAGQNQVSLSWPAASGASSYDVKRSTAYDGVYVVVGSDITATNLLDTGLANGVTYYYTVTAKNSVGRSADSTPVGVTPVGPPSAPGNLSANVGDATVTLTWTASGGATSYSIKRSTTSGGPYTTLASVSTPSYTDTAVSNQVTYYYVVSATNSYGEGPNSAEIVGTPQAQYIVDNADPTGLTITGSWTISTSATTYYGTNYLHDANTGATGGKSVRFSPNLPSPVGVDVYLRWPAGTNRASNVPVDINHSAGTTTVTVNQRANDGVWTLVGHFNFAAGSAGNVTIRNDGANGFVIADAAKFVVTSPITAPPAPTGLTAAAGDSRATLNWSAVSGATSYTVKRSTVSGGPFTAIASGITAPSYIDATASNGTTYFYVVSASNLAGEGANSTQVFATPSAENAIAITYVSSGRSYDLSTARVGQTYAIDRTFTITQLSAALTNATMIRTAYDDKALTTATHLKFTVGQPTIVYVCYDTRVTTLPAFLDSSWSLTSETFSTTHSLASPFKVFTKTVPAGTVTLGANMQSPAAGTWGASAAHYVVLIIPVPPTTASISLSDLDQTYDGAAKPVTVTTNPAGLDVALTYNGASSLPLHAGSYAVTADITTPHYKGSTSGTLIVEKAAATLALGGLAQIYDGAPKVVTVATSPANLPANLTYNGNATPPTDAGDYAVTATISDPDYAGTTSGSLVVSPATATVILNGLAQTFDGSPKPITATTNPAGLVVNATYNGNTTPPTNAGSYAVTATVTDPNYVGAGTGTLIIAKSSGATVSFSGLNQTYDGTAKAVSVATTPSGLTVNLTYDGSTTPPMYPGSHTVTGTIDDANYTGTASATLTISAANVVRHAPTVNGIVDGSLQLLSPENLVLNSSATVSGDLLVPGTPTVQVNAQPNYAGTIDGPGSIVPSNYTATLNSGTVLRHVVRRIDATALPIVNAPPAPAGTRSVTLNSSSQSAGDFSTLRDLTLNSNVGNVPIPAGTYGNFTANSGSGFILGAAGATEPMTYNLQHLTLNSGSALQIVSPVILTLANGVAFNISTGDAAHPDWFVLKVYSGGVTLNSGATLNGFVTAPNGTVTINGACTLKGRSASDRLTLNSTALLEEHAP